MDNEQEQKQSPIDQLNNSVRSAKTWANRAKKAFKLGSSPANVIEKTVAKEAAKQIITHGARTIFLGVGGSTLLFILIVLLILLPPFSGTGEGAPIPPGGNELVPINTGPLSCPVSGGRSQVTCGGKISPVNGCGHCGIGYAQYMSGCTYEGINHAMDIAASAGAPIYLPTIGGDTIQWTFLSQAVTGGGAIQRYAGRNTKTQEQYFIQFHHTQPGSGKAGARPSGELAGQVCLSCKNNNHVHVELENGGSSYLEASRYFCTQ